MAKTLREFIEVRIEERRAQAQRVRETTLGPTITPASELHHEHPFMVGAFIAMWGNVLEKYDREARVLHDLLVEYDRHHHD